MVVVVVLKDKEPTASSQILVYGTWIVAEFLDLALEAKRVWVICRSVSHHGYAAVQVFCDNEIFLSFLRLVDIQVEPWI